MIWDNPSKTTIDLGFNQQNVWSSEIGDRVSFFVIAGDKADEIYPAQVNYQQNNASKQIYDDTHNAKTDHAVQQHNTAAKSDHAQSEHPHH